MLRMVKTEFRALVKLLKGLPTIKRDWKCKTPLQKWWYLRDLGKIGFGLAGVPLFHEDQSLHSYSYFAYMYLGLCTSFVVYTACFYISHGDFMKFLPSTCLLVGPLFAVSFGKFIYSH